MPILLISQCDPLLENPLSPRIANYTIRGELDHENHQLSAQQEILWINTSPDTIWEVRLYMYVNAFKNLNSTFLKGINGTIFGRDLTTWPDENFGWLSVVKISDDQDHDLTDNQEYIQPDDDNDADQSVLQIALHQAVEPGDSLRLNLEFNEQLPRIIVRTGWAPNDYFAFLHWFPQMGVYEQDQQGQWGWNCHQFFRGTEFYADFGVYDVEIIMDQKFVVGSSGCIVEEEWISEEKKKVRMHGEDIIDFAWIAYPEFEEYTDRWNNTIIKMLITPAHRHLAPRFILAVKQVLDYMTDRIGAYPYPMITIVDPPIQALNSGFMEYPTLITVGGFHVFPKSLRSLESLAMHEFLHQYFMGMVASNEKEEAWLDEGFVTYFEDRILDDLYGPKDSYIDLAGYQTGNAEFSRQEYVSLPDPNEFAIATPGWQITDARKGIIYSKTALMLKTLEGMVGRQTMDEVMRTYFQKWKFKHPRGQDFIAVAEEVILQSRGESFTSTLSSFFEQTVYEATFVDFRVDQINPETNSFTVIREGDLVIPVEVKVIFQDESEQILGWDAQMQQWTKSFPSTKKIKSVHIDPDGKIPLDLDINNNSRTLRKNHWVNKKYVAKIMFWVQNTLQTISMMF